MAKKKLTPKQMQIARVAPPRNKITGADFKKLRKGKKINKPYARKIQILTVMEQRAKVMGKTQVVNVAKQAKQSLRKKHGKEKAFIKALLSIHGD